MFFEKIRKIITISVLGKQIKRQRSSMHRKYFERNTPKMLIRVISKGNILFSQVFEILCNLLGNLYIIYI